MEHPFGTQISRAAKYSAIYALVSLTREHSTCHVFRCHLFCRAAATPRAAEVHANRRRAFKKRRVGRMGPRWRFHPHDRNPAEGSGGPRRRPLPALLEIEDVAMRFGGIVALDAVTFSVAKGRIMGLIGPNGAGKTTLFNCLSRLYRQARGDIRLNGQSLRPAHLRTSPRSASAAPSRPRPCSPRCRSSTTSRSAPTRAAATVR